MQVLSVNVISDCAFRLLSFYSMAQAVSCRCDNPPSATAFVYFLSRAE
jgi:hypothetical protein